MKIFIISLFVLTGLTGCFTSGTKTIYKADKSFSINNLGYVQLTNDSALSKVYPKTNELYKDEVAKVFKQNGINNLQYAVTIINYDNPDVESIKSLCLTNNMDALLISQLVFTRQISGTKTYVGTEVDSKLYDRYGTLLVNASHNTLQDNTYRMPITNIDEAVRQGTKKAITRVSQELRMVAIN
jgi:hypothetical protein